MRATIYINRQTISNNKKNNQKEPAICIRTYKGVEHANTVEFKAGARLIQDAEHARCSGATVWLEAEYESLVIN